MEVGLCFGPMQKGPIDSPVVKEDYQHEEFSIGECRSADKPMGAGRIFSISRPHGYILEILETTTRIN